MVGPVTQTLDQFTQSRTDQWHALEALVDQARGRVDRLDADGVRRLGEGYREVVADLALARRRFPHDPVRSRLESLARQARPLVYGSVTERPSVGHFVTTGYWQRIVERPIFLLIAALALFVPTLAVGGWSHGHPTEAARMASVSPLTQGLSEGAAPRDPDTDKVTNSAVNAGLSAQIFTNNARVALSAFAGGLTAVVLTLVSLIFNGVVLGLVGGLSVKGGHGDSLWRLVVPHGVLELSLITVSGAAGLRLGWALLHPGHRTRGEALRTEGRAALEMALGSAALLVPCGLVEGFVTPRGLSLAAALAVGLGLGAAYWAIVWWRGLRTNPVGLATAGRST